MRLEIKNKLYAVDCPVGSKPCVEINNHWNNDKIVVIVIEGKSLELSAKELKAAIDNATNTARY